MKKVTGWRDATLSVAPRGDEVYDFDAEADLLDRFAPLPRPSPLSAHLAGVSPLSAGGESRSAASASAAAATSISNPRSSVLLPLPGGPRRTTAGSSTAPSSSPRSRYRS